MGRDSGATVGAPWGAGEAAVCQQRVGVYNARSRARNEMALAWVGRGGFEHQPPIPLRRAARRGTVWRGILRGDQFLATPLGRQAPRRGVWRGILRIDQVLAKPPLRIGSGVTAVCRRASAAHARVTRLSQNGAHGRRRRPPPSQAPGPAPRAKPPAPRAKPPAPRAKPPGLSANAVAAALRACGSVAPAPRPPRRWRARLRRRRRLCPRRCCRRR